VRAGQPLASVYARDDASLADGRAALAEAIAIADALTTPPLPLVSHRVTARGVERLA
jgi:hypothetical protein